MDTTDTEHRTDDTGISSNKRPETKVDEDDVGAGESAMARDRGARVARRDRGGTGGERGPHPGRQAQRARMDRGARVPSPVGARGHESV